MEIRKTELKKILFSELKPGDVFDWNGIIYMVTESIKTSLSHYYNCVDLRNGEFTHFENKDEVIKVKGYYKVE